MGWFGKNREEELAEGILEAIKEHTKAVETQTQRLHRIELALLDFMDDVALGRAAKLIDEVGEEREGKKPKKAPTPKEKAPRVSKKVASKRKGYKKPPKGYLTPEQAGKRIGKSGRLIRNWIAAGRLRNVIETGDKQNTRYVFVAEVLGVAGISEEVGPEQAELRQGEMLSRTDAAAFLGLSPGAMNGIEKRHNLSVYRPKGHGRGSAHPTLFPIADLRRIKAEREGQPKRANGTPMGMPEDLKGHVPVEQAAELLGQNPRRVRKDLAASRLRGKKVPFSHDARQYMWYVDLDSVDEALERQERTREAVSARNGAF